MNKFELQRRGITHILIAGDGWCLHPYYSATFEYLHLSLNGDGSETQARQLTRILPDAINFIVRALKTDPRNRVLVHCSQGQSRSPTIIAAYLMHVYDIDLHAALQHINGHSMEDSTERCLHGTVDIAQVATSLRLGRRRELEVIPRLSDIGAVEASL